MSRISTKKINNRQSLKTQMEGDAIDLEFALNELATPAFFGIEISELDEEEMEARKIALKKVREMKAKWGDDYQKVADIAEAL